MRSLSAFSVLVLAVASLISSSAYADDLFPPPWRGQPGSTTQEWEFSTPMPVSPPDAMMNPYGEPSAAAYPGTGQSWLDDWGGRQGMWPLSGTIEVTIPNSSIPNPYKDIWVQLTWARQVESSTPVVWEMNSNAVGTVVSDVILGPTGLPAPSDFWYHTTFLIHIEPNPAWEIVKIDGTVVVDQLVIDTICAPEPASLLLLGLGGLALRRRRA